MLDIHNQIKILSIIFLTKNKYYVFLLKTNDDFTNNSTRNRG